MLRVLSLTDPGAIGRLGGHGQSAAYAYSSSAAHYVEERYGQAKLLDLYDAFNDESLTGSRPELTDRVTRRVLRRSLARLERDLRRWIVTRAVVDPLAP